MSDQAARARAGTRHKLLRRDSRAGACEDDLGRAQAPELLECGALRGHILRDALLDVESACSRHLEGRRKADPLKQRGGVRDLPSASSTRRLAAMASRAVTGACAPAS